VAIDEVLLSRFDLRFALRDVPNTELDERLAEYVLKTRHTGATMGVEPVIESTLLRKYIAYARSHVHPKLVKEAGEAIKVF